MKIAVPLSYLVLFLALNNLTSSISVYSRKDRTLRDQASPIRTFPSVSRQQQTEDADRNSDTVSDALRKLNVTSFQVKTSPSGSNSPKFRIGNNDYDLYQRQQPSVRSSYYSPASSTLSCPPTCICDVSPAGKKRVTCSGHLTDIPTHFMDRDVQVRERFVLLSFCYP